MTPQQIYNRVAKHLLTQNRKSVKPGTMRCLYRGPNGLKCAIGILIPNKLYSEDMERVPVLNLCRFPSLKSRFDGHYSLLCELQTVHDSHPVRSWPALLRGVAREFDLKPVE